MLQLHNFEIHIVATLDLNFMRLVVITLNPIINFSN